MNGEWNNWSIGEGVTLPLDSEENDTYPVGLDIDFTSSDKIKASSPDQPDLPPCPLLYVLNTAGCLLVYQMVDKKSGERESSCPQMTTPVAFMASRHASPIRDKSPAKAIANPINITVKPSNDVSSVTSSSPTPTSSTSTFFPAPPTKVGSPKREPSPTKTTTPTPSSIAATTQREKSPERPPPAKNAWVERAKSPEKPAVISSSPPVDIPGKREKSPAKQPAPSSIPVAAPKRDKSPAGGKRDKSPAKTEPKVEVKKEEAPAPAASVPKVKGPAVHSVSETEGGELNPDFLQIRQIPPDVKVQVSSAFDLPEDEPLCYNLLAISNKFGYVVFATSNGFGFAFTKDIRAVIEKASARQVVPLDSITNIEVEDDVVNQIRLSADQKLIIIGTTSGTVFFYKASRVSAGDTRALKSVKSPTDNDFVLLPNPEVYPNSIAVNDADGTVFMLDIESDEFTPLEKLLPLNIFASALCWSRKGKQLAVGDQLGVVRQVSLDGTIKNTIDVPPSLKGLDVS
ncbi:hypothetical protein HDU99_004437, partial [Rhizoclosmatium hyalinum]